VRGLRDIVLVRQPSPDPEPLTCHRR